MISLAHSLNVAELSLAKQGLFSLSQGAEAVGGAGEVVPVLAQQAPPSGVVEEKPSRGSAYPSPHAPPPSPQLEPAVFDVVPVLGDRNGTAELLLFHKLGSHPGSDQASPTVSSASPMLSPMQIANPGAVVSGAEQFALQGALPEGSAELLLLKKARRSS